LARQKRVDLADIGVDTDWPRSAREPRRPNAIRPAKHVVASSNLPPSPGADLANSTRSGPDFHGSATQFTPNAGQNRADLGRCPSGCNRKKSSVLTIAAPPAGRGDTVEDSRLPFRETAYRRINEHRVGAHFAENPVFRSGHSSSSGAGSGAELARDGSKVEHTAGPPTSFAIRATVRTNRACPSERRRIADRYLAAAQRFQEHRPRLRRRIMREKDVSAAILDPEKSHVQAGLPEHCRPLYSTKVDIVSHHRCAPGPSSRRPNYPDAPGRIGSRTLM